MTSPTDFGENPFELFRELAVGQNSVLYPRQRSLDRLRIPAAREVGHWQRGCCRLRLPSDMAVGQNQWYHFGVGAVVYVSGDWDVHWQYGILSHGHIGSSLDGIWWPHPLHETSEIASNPRTTAMHVLRIFGPATAGQFLHELMFLIHHSGILNMFAPACNMCPKGKTRTIQSLPKVPAL